MDAGRRSTGTKAEYRDLVRVLHVALQKADACAEYTARAEATGDDRLAGFFRDVQGTSGSPSRPKRC